MVTWFLADRKYSFRRAYDENDWSDGKKNLLFFLCSLLFCFATSVIQAEGKYDSVLQSYVYEIRDPETDSKRFRTYLEKIGQYLALEVLEELQTKEVEVKTLLGATACHRLCDEKPVLVAILRAGVPLCHGTQMVFCNSEVGFLGMGRDEETLQPKLDYIALPDLKGKCVILTDTMIATGGSILKAIEIIEKQAPKRILVLGAIASKPGIANILESYPNIKIYTAAIDPALNEKGWIVPGLGDAGDRSYGKKSKN